MYVYIYIYIYIYVKVYENRIQCVGIKWSAQCLERQSNSMWNSDKLKVETQEMKIVP